MSKFKYSATKNALRSSEGLSHLYEYPTTGYKGPGYTGNIINGVISLGKV
jgi:hypothetical protein